MENLMNEGLENLMETEVVEEAIDVVEDVIETTGVNKYAKAGIAAIAAIGIGVTAYGVKKFIDWRKAKKNDNVIEVKFTECEDEYPEVNEEE